MSPLQVRSTHKIFFFLSDGADLYNKGHKKMECALTTLM